MIVGDETNSDNPTTLRAYLPLQALRQARALKKRQDKKRRQKERKQRASAAKVQEAADLKAAEDEVGRSGRSRW